MALTANEVLLKVRKSAHASLSYKAMGAALAPVGWKVEKLKSMVGPVRSAYDFAALTPALHAMAGMDGGERGDREFYVSYAGRDGDELPVHGSKEVLDKLVAGLKPGTERDGFTLVEVVGLAEGGRDDGLVLLIKVNAVKPGVRMVSPRGEEIRVISKRSNVATYEVMPLAEKAGLIEDVSAHLGMLTPAEEKSERDNTFDRTDVANTGSCPCCFGLYKLDSEGKMVHHGYERPGYGYIVGDCFGVGYLPFEISPEGTKDFAVALTKRKDNLAEYLDKLNSGKVTSLPEEVTEGYGRDRVTKIVDHEMGTKRFAELLVAEISNVTTGIARLAATIKELDAMVAAWVLTDLPEVRVARGEKLMRLNYCLIGGKKKAA